jgi:RNA polymerase sigma factor (sigma-70 family)
MPMLIYAAKSPPSGMTTDTCDVCLVAAAKNGDHQAYAELCRRHSQRTLRTVLRITCNIADAEDTLQEALLKAYTHIGEFDGRSAFSSWLTRIAINAALMLLRKTRSQPVYGFKTDPEADNFRLPEPAEPSYNPEESCIQSALENELTKAIRYLSPCLRVVIELRCQEDASMAQIAKTLGISKSAVKSRLARARLQIRKRLGENRCLRRRIDSRTLSSFILMSATSGGVLQECDRPDRERPGERYDLPEHLGRSPLNRGPWVAETENARRCR